MMNISLRLIIALSISFGLVFSQYTFAASLGTQDLLSLDSLERQMKTQYEKRGGGYISQAKEQLENMKRMGGKDQKTQQIIMYMDRYLKILEAQQAAKMSAATPALDVSMAPLAVVPASPYITVPVATSASTATERDPIVLGKPKRRYRKVSSQTSDPTLLSDEQFNSSSSQSVAKPRTKNVAVVVKKTKGPTKLVKLDPHLTSASTTTPIATAKPVASPVVTSAPSSAAASKPVTTPAIKIVSTSSASVPNPAVVTQKASSKEPTNALLQNVLDQATPILKTAPASFTLVPVQATDARINESKLRTMWMKWVNDLRMEQGLPAYLHESKLDVTAKDWSVFMAQKQVADHKRTPASSYYSYTELETRFAQKNVAFTLMGNSTFTENVGWTYLECGKTDCTDQAIVNMRTIFDYFVSEKDKSYRAHRETMVHPLFKVVGVGIVYAADQKRLYLTAHYGTELE